MYNQNYGAFEHVQTHSELLNAVLNRKTSIQNPQRSAIQTVTAN